MSFLRKQDGQPDCQPRGIFERLRLTDLETQPMLQLPTPLRGSCRSALALLALFAPFSAHAEETPPLKPLIVSALRIPQEASTVTSAVTVLDPKELESQGILQLRDALNAAPGVISTSTGGQTGAVGSLFIRGTKTADSQVVVDGMRLSDSTTQLGGVLAAGRAYDIGNIEVLRGAQGAIYGGESVGGVLWMETPRGSGNPHGSTSAEAGSFASFATHSMFQGETANLSYYLSGGYEETDNDGPSEQFHQANTALRVEGKIDSVWTVGTTFRAANNFYNDHGNSDNSFESELATLYATGKISNRWASRFHAGFQQELYDNDSSFGNYGTDMRAASLATDQELTLAENVRLLAGAYVHESSYQNTIGTDQARDRYGVHSVVEWDIIEHLTTTAALRWEHYDAYGDELTWRFGSIYNIVATGTSLRGGVGSSFRSPSYLDLFGSSYGAGNPDLAAVSTLGWDLGFEQKIGAHHSVEVTGFKNSITDQIESPAGSSPVNLPGTSTTDGLEVGIRGNWLDSALNYRLAWTYLHESLSDQPRNAATAAIDWKPSAKSLIGIGATHLSEHSWGSDPIASYTVARLYGSYQLTDKVKFNARIENLFDKGYKLYGGNQYAPLVEGSGTGLYAGVTVDW
jgi:outer membrane cobalamin receptor